MLVQVPGTHRFRCSSCVQQFPRDYQVGASWNYEVRAHALPLRADGAKFHMDIRGQQVCDCYVSEAARTPVQSKLQHAASAADRFPLTSKQCSGQL